MGERARAAAGGGGGPSPGQGWGPARQGTRKGRFCLGKGPCQMEWFRGLPALLRAELHG